VHSPGRPSGGSQKGVKVLPRGLMGISLSSSWATVALLVHQGSSPTLPYQALGDPRERHSFLGVCPMGTEGVLGPFARFGPWGLAAPDSLDCTRSAPSRASTLGKRAA